jgi:hypothetical protein
MDIRQWVQTHRRFQNLTAATRELQLTPQEQYAYRHHLGNLERGGVPHPDGSVSSFLNTTVGFGNKTYVLPTVWDNKIVTVDDAVRRAREDGLEKWPSYDSVEQAEKRYQAMHGYMERDTGAKLNANSIRQPVRDGNDRAVEGAQPASPPRVD